MIKIHPKEILTFKYWIHIFVIAILVLFTLQLWQGGEMFTIKNVLIGTGMIGVADIIAHTLFGLD
jgi:hypothetical protein